MSRALISWGQPAQIANSRESHCCGRCGAMKGIYGKDFGFGPDGNPIPTTDNGWDLTVTAYSECGMCWICLFSYVVILKPGEPQPPQPVKKKKKRKCTSKPS